MNQVITTSASSASNRVAAWNEAACTYLTPMNVQPLDSVRFFGQMRRSVLASVRAVDISCGAARVDRSQAHIARTAEAVFVVDLQLDGESTVRQAGREARLHPGDFVLTDSTRPHQVSFESPVTMRLLKVPAATLRRVVGCPEDLVGLRVDGTCGAGRLASQFVRSLWHDDGREELAGISHIERAALELLAGAFAEYHSAEVDRSSLAALHRMRIVEYVEQHLQERELTPSSIAQAMRIGRRYLHRLFSGHADETIGRYILRRRLECSAEQLVDPLHARRHVSDIAYGCGFSTLAYFCRSFRERYALSPVEYRNTRSQQLIAERPKPSGSL